MQYKPVLFAVMFGVAISPVVFFPAAEAFDAQRELRRPLVIRHIRKQQAGVLISRPDPLDEKIRDIIIANDIASVADYVDWLAANIRYQNDKGKDLWLLPEDTLAKGSGDCEDMAFLNQAVLRVLGYEARVLCVFRIFRSHAICVFKDNGYYQIVDNTKLKQTPARSFSELTRYIFTIYNCASIGEADLQTRDYRILVRRKDLLSK